MRNINSRKAAGPDKAPPKNAKMSANIIDSHLTNIINSDLKRNAFSNSKKELISKITGQLVFYIAFKKFTKDSYTKILCHQ